MVKKPGDDGDWRLPGGAAARSLALRLRAGHMARESVAMKRVRTMKVRVHVSLKNGVLDPQGRAIHHALEGMGFAGINDVRAGRLIELDVTDSVTDGEIDAMCHKLLANQVIENYRIERA